MDDRKIKPYDQLKSILNEGILTDKASENLNEILGVRKRFKFLEKIKSLFSKIDSLIFRENKSSTQYNKR